MQSQRIVLRTLPGVGIGRLNVADFDGDDDEDVLAMADERGEPAELFLLRNDGTGRFAIADVWPLAPVPGGIEGGDFDGDGDADVAITHNSPAVGDPYLTTLENDGNGGLSARLIFVDDNVRPGWVRVADLNGDGWPDLSFPSQPRGIIVHLNDGAGGFSSRAWYTSMSPSTAVEIDDFDGDGRVDLLSGGMTLELLPGLRCLCPADLTGDGALDADDFFLYLDLFAAADPRADFTGDGTIDANDFFADLDAFAAGCGG